MPTNILSLPLISIEITTGTNEDWRDSIMFAAPSSPGEPVALIGVITSGQATVTGLSSTSGLVTGMGVAGVGIPAGATILAITGATTLTLSANATATNIVAALTFNPVPLDLTGIEFRMTPRRDREDIEVAIEASTENERLINGGLGGQLGWLVPAVEMGRIRPATYAFDVVATADGATIKCVEGNLTVERGYTRPA